ncbi:type II toxin-antitoxin system HicB family antitoxin [Acidaminococcus fermentans]|uniref:type II toxin-antitoxin system HicB family antitoxin n=1 Tax=Acidaminococcus fermentans TaxID=905 RepID=UPI0030770496
MKKWYPAIVTHQPPEEGFPAGCYSVDFPGMDACYTFGATMEEALEMAEDVLNLRMVEAEDAGEKNPAISRASSLVAR